MRTERSKVFRSDDGLRNDQEAKKVVSGESYDLNCKRSAIREGISGAEGSLDRSLRLDKSGADTALRFAGLYGKTRRTFEFDRKGKA